MANPASQQGYRLAIITGTTFRLQNFVGNGSSAADVTAWVNVTKSNTGSTQIVGPPSVVFSTAPAPCTLPTLP